MDPLIEISKDVAVTDLGIFYIKTFI